MYFILLKIYICKGKHILNGSIELIHIKSIHLIAGLIIQFCRLINNMGRILI